MYFFPMKNMFHKTPFEIPKPPSPKEKHQSLLHSIGGGWYISENIPPPNKRKLSKKYNKRIMK